MTTEKQKAEIAELERLSDEASKARKAATEAQAIADRKTDEFFHYARWLRAEHCDE
jgi:hypothetical protein